jgi:hypothetical protein
MAKIDINPPVDPRLYTVMKQIYSQYTGYQIAEVIKVIRKEIQDEEEAQKLKAELKRLKSLVKDSLDE